MRKVNVLVLGDSFVGKTAIITQLTQHTFQHDYKPTVEDETRFILEYDEKSVELTIFDTSGSPDFIQQREDKYATIDGFIAVYSIMSSGSFDVLNAMLEKLKVIKGDSIPLVLVGCKMDLEDQRQVSTEHGAELAKNLNCPFAEISAKEKDHVVDVFMRLMREIDRCSGHKNAPATCEAECEKKQKKCCVVL